jgi:hypothetical protein
MKSCKDCKHASWVKTAAGKLHPNGAGLCLYSYNLPKLPASMHWLDRPVPVGGYINRRKELPDHCVYWAKT